ncbi:hypothetical protein D3C74_415810 [compost metagenome]
MYVVVSAAAVVLSVSSDCGVASKLCGLCVLEVAEVSFRLTVSLSWCSFNGVESNSVGASVSSVMISVSGCMTCSVMRASGSSFPSGSLLAEALKLKAKVRTKFMTISMESVFFKV